jgi:two-component system response regulator
MNLDSDAVDVLMVEDSESDAELALRALKKRRLANKVVWLKDGAEALDFLFATGVYADRSETNHPKIVLLDLNLPKRSGIEVLRELKANRKTRSIPVIVLTSSQDDLHLEECYRLGANSYIVKPVDFKPFAELVGNLGFYWLLVNDHPGD